jgi:anti-sigma B factor antagonist
MSSGFTVQAIEKFSVIEFQNSSMMDPIELESMSKELNRLIDEEDRRRLILDFERVQYVSSQALGIVMAVRKKLAALPHSKLVLCSVCDPLMKLLKITALDKVLTIKKTQKEAIKVWE